MRRIRNWSIGLAVPLVLAGTCVSPHFSRDTYVARVTGKERITDGDDSRYLVYTKLMSGKVRVFENTDSRLELKFNSSDFQAEVEEGKTYEFKTYGWRIPVFSKYENIIGIKELDELPLN